jgi:hypothetical protein
MYRCGLRTLNQFALEAPTLRGLSLLKRLITVMPLTRWMRLLAWLCAVLPGLFVSSAAMAIEEPAYSVVRTDGAIELRQYRPFIVAETMVDGDLDAASSAGFRRIAAYIFGANTSVRASAAASSEKIDMTAPVTVSPATTAPSEKIAMTAPVTTAPQGVEAGTLSDSGRWRVHFVMPASYTMATLPRPNDPSVSLREVPGKRAAVVRFSGFAGTQKVQREAAALLQWVRAQGLKPTGSAQLSRYDPPWTLPFMRRNEVMIEVSD